MQITGVGVVKLEKIPMEEDPWVPHQVRVELLKPQAATHMVKFAEGALKPGPVGGAATGIKKTASTASACLHTMLCLLPVALCTIWRAEKWLQTACCHDISSSSAHHLLCAGMRLL